MANIANGSGLNVRSEINNEIMSYDECFDLDLKYHFWKNTKAISTFESTETYTNNSWDATVGTVAADTVNFKVGTQGRSFTSPNNAGGGKMASAMDLAKFNDGQASATADYIQFCIYITTAEQAKLHANGILLRFPCDAAPTLTNNFNYAITAASLTPDVWTHFSIAKSAFTSTGAPNWTDVKGVDFTNNGVPTSASPLYTVDALRMVRKDPSAASANPFQKLVDSVWTRDCAINACTWFLGIENGEITCRNLSSIAGNNSLLGIKSYNNFDINCSTVVKATGESFGPVWWVDASNYVKTLVIGNALYLIKCVATTSTNYSTSMTVAIGDTVIYRFSKSGKSFAVMAFKNGDMNTPYLVNIEQDYTTSVGYIGIATETSSVANLLNFGVSKIEYANVAGEAYLAKNLIANSNVDIGNFNLRAKTLESDVATGTAPLVVASTTVVANLNAYRLGGQRLVEVVNSSVVILGSATALIDLRAGGTHKFYLLSAYSSAGYTVTLGDSIEGDFSAFFDYKPSGSNDTLYLRNHTGTSLTVYYKVDTWEA